MARIGRTAVGTPTLVAAGVLTLMGLLGIFVLRGYGIVGAGCIGIAALLVLLRVLGTVARRVLVGLVCAALVCLCCLEVPIVRDARTDAEPGTPYLVVLGAAVHGDYPSSSLLYRLEGTLEYLRDNPGTVAIVSGGQGEGENLSEALCMYEWLVARGVDPGRVVMESRATSTRENLEFSFDIIRSRGDEPSGNVAIASSSYHLCRAKMIASDMGVQASGVACATGNPFLTLNYFVREAFGVGRLMVLGY